MADRIDTNTRKRSSSSPEVVRKRRSSIFRRKSLGKQTDVNNEEENIKEENVNDSQQFNLRDYIDKLKEERDMWKEELKARKKLNRNVAKDLERVETAGQKLDLHVLSPEQKLFLNSQPNLEEIHNKATTVANLLVKVKGVQSHIGKINNSFRAITDEIIQNSKAYIIKSND